MGVIFSVETQFLHTPLRCDFYSLIPSVQYNGSRSYRKDYLRKILCIPLCMITDTIETYFTPKIKFSHNTKFLKLSYRKYTDCY